MGEWVNGWGFGSRRRQEVDLVVMRCVTDQGELETRAVLVLLENGQGGAPTQEREEQQGDWALERTG